MSTAHITGEEFKMDEKCRKNNKRRLLNLGQTDVHNCLRLATHFADTPVGEKLNKC